MNRALARPTPVYGGALPKADFGDPTVATSYTLCVFDGSGSVLAGFAMPADGDCADRSCWRSTSRGFRLRRSEEGQQGRSSIKATLREGAQNRPPKLVLRSKGPVTALATFGTASQPVTVQLATDDNCWGAVFQARAAKNGGDRFKDKTP